MHFATLDGFGGTPPPHDKTISGYATRVANYIKRNKLTNIIAIGHSFGGRIAIELAQHINLVALVLVDSAGVKPKFSIKKSFSIFRYKIYKWLVKRGVLSKDKLRKFGSDDYKNCSNEMKEVFMNAIHYNQTKQLCKITIPTLIVWGKNDKDTPIYMAKTIHHNVRDSEIVVLNGGHFCFLENTFQFVGVLQCFFDKIGERGKNE